MIVKGSPAADASLAHREKALIATCKMNAVNPYAYDIQSLQVLRNMIKGHRDYWCYLVALLPKKINSDDKLPNGDECDKVAQSMHPAYSFAGKQSEIGQIFRAGSVANAAPLLPGVFLDLTVP